MVLATGCGSGTTLNISSPGTSSTIQKETTTAPSVVDEAPSTIEIVVVLPGDWPNPIYPGLPDIVVEGSNGEEFRSLANLDRIDVRLPSSGDYSVGATIEDGGCYDTAGVTQSGNRPIAVAHGDVIVLQDTGEICD